MNEEFKHSLSGLLYNMYFGSYEEENDFSHSKKGQTWKKHKYIRKENGKYIYPKGTSGLNTKRNNAHRYAWKTEYNNERTKYGAELAADMGDYGKVYIYTTEDGTVVISHPPYAKYTMPKGTDVQAVKSRLKNYANKIDASGYNLNIDLTKKFAGDGADIYLEDVISGKSDDTARYVAKNKVTKEEVEELRNSSPALKTMDERMSDMHKDRVDRYNQQKEDKEEYIKTARKIANYLTDDFQKENIINKSKAIGGLAREAKNVADEYGDDFRKKPKKK